MSLDLGKKLTDQLIDVIGKVEEIGLPTQLLTGSKFNSAMGIMMEYIIVSKIDRMELVEGSTIDFPDLQFTSGDKILRFEVKALNVNTKANAPIYRSQKAKDHKLSTMRKSGIIHRLMVIDWDYEEIPKEKHAKYEDDLQEFVDLKKSLSYPVIKRIRIYKIIEPFEEHTSASLGTKTFISQYEKYLTFDTETK